VTAYKNAVDFVLEFFNPFGSSVLLKNMLFFVPDEVIPFIHFFFSVMLVISAFGVIAKLATKFASHIGG